MGGGERGVEARGLGRKARERAIQRRRRGTEAVPAGSLEGVRRVEQELAAQQHPQQAEGEVRQLDLRLVVRLMAWALALLPKWTEGGLEAELESAVFQRRLAVRARQPEGGQLPEPLVLLGPERLELGAQLSVEQSAAAVQA